MDMTAALTVSAVAMATYLIFTKVKDLLGASKVYSLLDAGVAVPIVDVRSREEHEQRRIAGSVNVPLELLKSNIGNYAPDKTAPVAVYCLSGGRARSAASTLKGLGYKTVYNLGGVDSWKREFDYGKTRKTKKK